MPDLSTTYMGLQLTNPIIAASSGLTKSVDQVSELAEAGAGAIVLKSLFEEDLRQSEDPFSRKEMERYMKLIRECREAVSVPVFGSIHCLHFSNWINHARDIEEAGASGLELNLFTLPSDPLTNHAQIEETYLDIIQEVLKKVHIPVAVKLGPYFTGLANSVMRFSWTGLKGMVLFNRFYSIDIDIHKQEVIPGFVLSSPSEVALPLRWTALLSTRVGCDIAAATGIHSTESAIKLLLAGAKAVQICSVLYRNGPSYIQTMLSEIQAYMEQKGYSHLEDFNGLMSLKSVDDPAVYERVQFMKHYSTFE